MGLWGAIAMDLQTLHIQHAALLGCFTLLTFVNAILHWRMPGTRWFPVFTTYAFAGAVLIALRGAVPDILSVFGGALLFPIAYAFLHRSLTEFFGKGRTQWRLQLLLVTLSAVLLFEWGVLAPNTRERLTGYSLLLATQLAMTAIFVLRHATGTVRWSGRMMGGLLLLLSMNNLLRAALVWSHRAPARYAHSGGAMSWVLLAVSVLQGASIVAFVWMTAERLRERLEHEATTDPLTHLLNRRALETRASREIAASRQEHLPLSAILLDLDDFKAINDAWGHQCGDTVLRMTARCLETQLRDSDALARLGGDEFVVLLPRTSRHEALGVAEQLRGCLEELRCCSGAEQQRVRASFGIAELHDDDQTWEHLIQRCDRALYAVKAVGGNRVLVH